MSDDEKLWSLHHKAQMATLALREVHGVKENIDVGVSLGSGFRYCTQLLSPGTKKFIPYTPIPCAPPVYFKDKREGGLWIGQLEGSKTWVGMLEGRPSLSRGFTPPEIIHMTRVLAMLGMKRLVVLTAAGGITSHFKPGRLAVARDHICARGHDPLADPDYTDPFGSQRLDMRHTYDLGLRECALKAARESLGNPGWVHEGIYHATELPQLETPAEVAWFRDLLIDFVGRTGIWDVMAARQQDIRCALLAVITNVAAGRAPERLTQEVIEQAVIQAEQAVLPTLRALLMHPLPA